MKKTFDELRDELCNYCSAETKGSRFTPGSESIGCEGRWCGDAYENYLDEIADNEKEN